MDAEEINELWMIAREEVEEIVELIRTAKIKNEKGLLLRLIHRLQEAKEELESDLCVSD